MKIAFDHPWHKKECIGGTTGSCKPEQNKTGGRAYKTTFFLKLGHEKSTKKCDSMSCFSAKCRKIVIEDHSILRNIYNYSAPPKEQK